MYIIMKNPVRTEDSCLISLEYKMNVLLAKHSLLQFTALRHILHRILNSGILLNTNAYIYGFLQKHLNNWTSSDYFIIYLDKQLFGKIDSVSWGTVTLEGLIPARLVTVRKGNIMRTRNWRAFRIRIESCLRTTSKENL